MLSCDIEKLLREEWWLNHGCAQHAQYGDDGERQCGECLVDFKRLPLDELSTHVGQRRIVQVNIAIQCNKARDLIDKDRFDEARAILNEVQKIARPEHTEIFYLRQLIPPIGTART